MSDAPIVVEITDKVSPAIAKKLRDIGTQARTSQTQVDKLKASLAALGKSNPLTRLQTEMRNVNTETLKAAQASQRLSTEQARTAAASQRLATEQQRTAAAAQRVATEQQKTATAQGRAATTAAQAAAAAQRLTTEQQRTATAAAQAAAAQSRAAQAALRLEQAQARGAAQARRYAGAMNAVRTALAFAGVSVTAGAIVGMGDAYTTLQNKLQVVATSQAQVNELTNEMFDLANRTRSEVGATTQAFVRFDRAMSGLGRSQQDTIRLTETINKALIISGATTQEAQSSLLQLSQAFNAGRLSGDEFRSVSENMPIVLDALARSMGVPVGALKDLGAEGKITSEQLITALDLIESEVDAAFANTVPTMAQAFVVLRNSATQFFGEFNNATGLTNGLAQAILFVAENIGRFATYAATAAAIFAGAYVYGLVAAAVATGGLSAALGILRTALIRTGIGAIIVLIGELIYRFAEASREVGGVGRMFQIMGDTGKAALDWVIAGGYAMVDAFNGITLTIGAVFTSLWASIQRGFANLMAALQAGINTMITSLNEAFTFSINNPFTGEVMAQMNGLGIATTNFAEGYIKAADDSAAAAEDLSRRADAAFESMGNRFADLRNPLDVFSEGMSTARAETEAANAAAGELDTTLRGATEPAAGTGAGTGGAGGGGGGNGGATESLRKYLDEMDREMELLKLLPKEREIEAAVQEKVNKLREKGINLSAAEIELLRSKTEALREANAVAEQEAALMNATVYKREEYIQQLKAIQNLLTNPESGFTNADALNQLAQTEVGAYLEHLPEMVNARVEQFKYMYEQVDMLRQADLISEQSASAAKMQIWAAEQKAKTDVFANFFGGIAQLASSENEKLARIGKAAAITQTVIQTYQSATAAYASMAGIPVIGPALGIAAAAAAVAAGMANVAAIRAQSTSTGAGYMSGGYTGDGARNQVAGAVHGREYVLDAAATSRIGVDDLNALRRGAATVQRPDSEAAGAGQRVSANPAPAPAGQAAGATLNNKIVNVIDPALFGDYMSSPEGETAIVNVISRNPGVIKQVVSNG
ncbi:tapemeasure [Rhodobacter phage RcSpartan]|uniref:Tapemeasure n=1 Tax=Rhodobacter phage RcSpartan TaxID=1662331 RepID=A0A0K1LL85_9CAUD|nr:tail length tape measure protein [Rhodobacter phage RcSpartan]AKU43204.1 tapemeasure [Rhodobacter phage RcSpartan]